MTLVERLRSVTAVLVDEGWMEHPGTVQEAADRIEALEEWDRKRAADIIKLGAMVGKLEAALRRIVGSQMIPWSPAHTPEWEIGFKMLQAIARDALEEQKEN